MSVYVLLGLIAYGLSCYCLGRSRGASHFAWKVQRVMDENKSGYDARAHEGRYP